MDRILVLLAIIVIVGGMIWLVRGGGLEKLGRARHQRLHHQPSHKDDAEKPAPKLAPKAQQLEKMRHSPQFWGVEVHHFGCSASRAIAERRFPFEDAPVLPLENCDAASCPCQYEGLKEHRSYHRRKQEDRRKHLRYDTFKPDRRMLRDRRRRFDQWKGRA